MEFSSCVCLRQRIKLRNFLKTLVSKFKTRNSFKDLQTHRWEVIGLQAFTEKSSLADYPYMDTGRRLAVRRTS